MEIKSCIIPCFGFFLLFLFVSKSMKEGGGGKRERTSEGQIIRVPLILTEMAK